MKSGFSGLNLGVHYEAPSDEISSSVILPLLQEAQEYDRVVTEFSSLGILAAAEGLAGLSRRGGVARILIGVDNLSVEARGSALRGQDSLFFAEIESRLNQILTELSLLNNPAAQESVRALASMIQDGQAQVKLAVPILDNVTIPFTNRKFLFRDANGNGVACVAGKTERVRSMEVGWEELILFSTLGESGHYAAAQLTSFEKLWGNQRVDYRVWDIGPDFAEKLIEILGQGLTEPDEEVIGELSGLLEALDKSVPHSLLAFRSAALYPHQERAFIESVGRWPIRVMLSDEVGLGKTLEAGAVIAHALKFSGVSRVMILAPAQLTQQWQEELLHHFGLNFWKWDSKSGHFLSATGEVLPPQSKTQILGTSSPNLVIISSQLARSARNQSKLFKRADVLPELLVVDEAHAARLRFQSNSARPTQLYRLLSKLVEQVPHVVFATATPLQLHPLEFFGLLSLLGLPPSWDDSRKYLRSLTFMAQSNYQPSLDDAAVLSDLLLGSLSVLQGQPATATKMEIQFAAELRAFGPEETVKRALHAKEKWDVAISLFIKTHPAHYLVVRNTRTALEKLNYRFPEREFSAPDLAVPKTVSNFFGEMNRYLRDAYGAVEEAANPKRRYVREFVVSTYHQRLASSLYAIHQTLTQREASIRLLLEALTRDDPEGSVSWAQVDEEDIDEVLEEDEAALTAASEQFDIPLGPSEGVRAAATRELTWLKSLLALIGELGFDFIEQDPKFLEAIQQISRMGGRRGILVFSRYTDTLKGFVKALGVSNLLDGDIGLAYYSGKECWIRRQGSVLPSSKTGITSALASGDVRIVLCSDAASEGLNLQAADAIINLDVPWNPARLEQRIGRVARLGQSSETVQIVNLWYPDSIESEMYRRLLKRRDLWQVAVGEFPEIVSGAIRNAFRGRFNLVAVDDEDGAISKLEEIRNNEQSLALQRVWNIDLEENSQSDAFRNNLRETIIAAYRSLAQTKEDALRQIEGSDHRAGAINTVTLRHPSLLTLNTVRGKALGETRELYAVGTPSQTWAFAITNLEGTYRVVRETDLPELLAACLGLASLMPKSLLPKHEIGDTALIERAWSEMMHSKWLGNPSRLNLAEDWSFPTLDAVVAEAQILPVGFVQVALDH